MNVGHYSPALSLLVYTGLNPFPEETLARREKFQKIGWLPPNHNPKTKKVIPTAKRLWSKYIICGCRLCPRGVTVRTADGVFQVL